MSDESNGESEPSPDRREFVRVAADLTIRYKFLSAEPDFPNSEVLEGKATDISGGGLLLLGRVPEMDWTEGLLMNRIFLGLNIGLDDGQPPAKALTRAAWIEPIEEGDNHCLMGLRFKEITREHQDRIFQFVIRAHMI